MNVLIFVSVLGASLAALFSWAFRVLPSDAWQILAAVPAVEQGRGVWRGVNLTYYGFFMATACAAGVALLFVLLGSIGVPLWGTASLVTATMLLCLPSASLVARLVERRRGTLSVAGAFAVGCIAVPAAIPALNATLGAAAGFEVPWLPALAAVAVAYALGEGVGRLACISFGCCYGKPLQQCHPLIRRALGRWSFSFRGQTRKAVYEGGLASVPLVPIQAVTAAFCAATALAGIWFFLHGHYRVALLAVIGVTQVWRLLSEFLRADYRGPTKLTPYQVMAVVAFVLAAVIVTVTADGSTNGPPADLLAGVLAMYDPLAILFLQGLWIAVFWNMGRSWVTESTIELHLCSTITAGGDEPPHGSCTTLPERQETARRNPSSAVGSDTRRRVGSCETPTGILPPHTAGDTPSCTPAAPASSA